MQTVFSTSDASQVSRPTIIDEWRRYELVLATSVVVAIMAANVWYMVSTARFANAHFQGSIPIGLATATALALQVPYFLLWIIATATIMVAFRWLEEAERTPRFAILLTLTGIAQVPLLLVSIAASLMWELALRATAERQLSEAMMMTHPLLTRASTVSAVARGLATAVGFAWLFWRVRSEWQMSTTAALTRIGAPLAGLVFLLALASRVLTFGNP